MAVTVHYQLRYPDCSKFAVQQPKRLIYQEIKVIMMMTKIIN